MLRSNTRQAEGRDRFLRQLGISRWRLRYPKRLQGVSGLPVAQEGLVLLAETLPSLETPLLQDVFRLLCVTGTPSVRTLADPQIPIPYQALLWCLGTAIPSWARRYLSSPPLAELLVNPTAKHQLWQQIAYYVDHCPPVR